MPPKHKNLTGETAQLLQTVVDHFNNEDIATRQRQIRHYRRLKLYWNNFSQIYWSETAHDYRVYGRDSVNSDTDQDYYDKPVNVFRAFLETIIAALSVQIPAVSCSPDDADNPLDMSTAKGGDKIAELIYKHNNASFLWLNALYVYCTEGMIAAYNYPKEDESYGTYQKKNYKDSEEEHFVCPGCNATLEDDIFTNKEKDEYDPDADDVKLHNLILNEDEVVCPACGEALDPELQKQKLIVTRLVGTTTAPKTRVCIEVYGGLYVKIANYAKKVCDTPYLRFSYETSYVNALEEFPWMRAQVPQGGWENMGPNDPYEQFARLNTQYRGEFPIENVTISRTWLRPASFNVLPEESYQKLKRKFPDGCKVSMINSEVADYENESLDDRWTLSRNPMSDFLTHDPLGELLTNLQDITNDLISLTLQTIEQGIAQTFADPSVIDFDAQRQIEAMPGTLSPTKPLAGSKNINDAFFTIKQANLSPEIFQFYKIVNDLGQFVSGALPSLSGGVQNSGSNTASEYAMSRAQAMQRLQTPWKMMTIWWKELFGKVIPTFIKLMEDDERIVEKSDRGNFINVFLRRAELEGKIGNVELESAEQIPITDEQQRSMLMDLMKLNNQEIMAAFTSPENLPMIRKLVKIPQFKIPGEDDRQKQYEEINELINSEPVTVPIDPAQLAIAEEAGEMVPPDQQNQQFPSVEIDPIVDNHEVEAATCRSWLISEAGRLAKIENPNGYKNVLLHMKAHLDMIKQNMTQMAESAMPPAGMPPQETETPKGSVPAEKPSQPEKVNGEASARSPIS